MINTKLSKTGIPYLHFGTGEPLVLIHGLGEVKEGWQSQYELSESYELIIPDLRGHGEYKIIEDISIETFAKDVIGLLHELKIESANILGLSMGGAVAQEIYRQAPEMCRSLILTCTFHYLPKRLGKLYMKYRESQIEELTVSERRDIAAKKCLYSWKEDSIKKFIESYQPERNAFLASGRACMQVNNLSLLPKIKVPTLIIAGQYDAVLPPWIQLWMHKLIPHSEFVIMKNTGHVPKFEAKDRYNRIVTSFLTKHRNFRETA
ncbi:alpha/beta hydrolase [Mesobacillus maritimus]|uniref:alpha/beta fold hydrolase n=1 Tax=Mesobacillus maritimus TaxID=1643336 RepID=UPI00203F0C85|nr:alpha/beta hydrolase [Mesobacillus maritimus]MCM3585603.1 alpha/beta hydrolase [Mesobacillus maritimus]MCM3669075.1 alpha/beta hydrolase [Mesobacillus maritimus]